MRRRSLLLAWALVGSWAPIAHAVESRVLVLQPAADSLFVALQIQLSGLAEPERVPEAPLAGAAEAIGRASRLVRDRGALAAVWVEHARGAGVAVVYVVGEREGRALVEVVRVAGDRRPDLERAIALKVREFVDAMRRGQAERPEAAQLLQPTRPPAAAEATQQPTAAAQTAPALPSEQAEEQPEDISPAAAPSWSALAFAGIRLGSQPDLGLGRWGFGLGAGPVLALRDLRLAVLLGFDAFPSVEVEKMGDRVRFWEWTAGAVLHAQLRAGAFWLGARVGPQLEGLNAHGTTRGVANRASEGDATEASGALLAGLDAEVAITSAASVIAGLQLQALASRVHLRVNDHDVVDLGRRRARLGLDLVARF